MILSSSIFISKLDRYILHIKIIFYFNLNRLLTISNDYFFNWNNTYHFALDTQCFKRPNANENSAITEKKENVYFMIKVHINKTKLVWKFVNKDETADWDKLQNWKFRASCKKKIKTLITFIHIKELNDLLHVEGKLTFMIFRYVRYTDAMFEIFILLEIININFKTFYSLDFNSNEKSLQFFAEQTWVMYN